MKNVMQELPRIIQDSGFAKTHAEQIQGIVKAISAAIDIDVCSLYLEAPDGAMILMASHGLSMHQPVRIPRDKGLVGLVTKSRHAINLKDAAEHPDYLYLPETHEEQFQSFCGVPLVRQGRVIGVLVVQSKQAVKLGSQQEAFLSTLATHLALVVADFPVESIPGPSVNLQTSGISGAPGLAIGAAKLSNAIDLTDISDYLSEDIDKDIQHWHALLAATIGQLQTERATIDKSLGSDVSGIFDAYQMLLSDPALIHKVEDEIRAGYALPAALKRAIHYFAELFRAMDDAYLKARHEDIQHLGNKLYQVWRGDFGTDKLMSLVDEPVVLVGAHISVSDIVSLPADKLVAVVCFDGAALSHIAIFANALGIPAVMGVGELKGLHEGSMMLVDGSNGLVIRQPSEVVLEEYRELLSHQREFGQQLQLLRDLPAITQDGIQFQLLVNSGLQADIMPGIRNGAEGIGLYRTEIPFMIRQSLPSEDEQVRVYREVCQAYAGKPVYIRTLDIGGDKPLPYFPVNNEENPALGWRGIRFTLDNVQLLMTQLRAIVRAANGRDNVHILLPMVSATIELTRVIELLDDACRQLKQEGMRVVRPKIGVMLEVPAVISLLPMWRDKIDFVSIGSNDLSQYLLAIDRNNPHVAKLYDSVHPAVIHELKRIVEITQKAGLPVCLCGEMASDAVSVLLLLGLGIRRLSMSSAKLPYIKWIIRSISLADAEQFLLQALAADSAEKIRRMGNDLLRSKGLQQGL